MCFLFVRIFSYFMTGTDKAIFQYAAFSNDRFIADDTVFDDNSKTKVDQYFISTNGIHFRNKNSFTLLPPQRHSSEYCSKSLFSYSLFHSIQERNSLAMFSPLSLCYRKRHNRSFGLISHCSVVTPVAVHLMETVFPRVRKSGIGNQKQFEIISICSKFGIRNMNV